jgi:hypothetical protein
MYAGGFKQVLYKEYICWIKVKIHISDQTSLRICNSVGKGIDMGKEEKKRGGGEERVGWTCEFIFLPRFSPYNSDLLCQLAEDGSSEGFNGLTSQLTNLPTGQRQLADRKEQT